MWVNYIDENLIVSFEFLITWVSTKSQTFKKYQLPETLEFDPDNAVKDPLSLYQDNLTKLSMIPDSISLSLKITAVATINYMAGSFYTKDYHK